MHFVICLMVALFARNIESSWSIVEVRQDVAVAGVLSHYTTSLSIQNVDSKENSVFKFNLDAESPSDISFVSYSMDEKVSTSYDVAYLTKGDKLSGLVCTLNLERPVKPKETVDLVVNVVYANKVAPLYKSQKLETVPVYRFVGSHFFSTYYEMEGMQTSATTTFDVSPEKEHTLNNDFPFKSLKENILSTEDFRTEYNPQNLKVAVFSVGKSDSELIHFESTSSTLVTYTIDPAFYKNNKAKKTFHVDYTDTHPHFEITNFDRVIYASQYGKAEVNDHYVITNTAPPMQDEFNRVQIEYSGVPSVIKSFIVPVPVNAYNIAFFDHVGNISTSHVLHDRKHQMKWLVLRPRYPLLGGWNTEFTVKYTMPVANILKQFAQTPAQQKDVKNAATNTYQVSIFYTPNVGVFATVGFASWFHDVKKANVKVVLPENAHNINFAFDKSQHNEYDNDYKPASFVNVMEGSRQISMTTTFSFLDTFGRPTVEINLANLVRQNVKSKLLVYYSYEKVGLIWKSYIVAAGTFVVLLLMSVVSRVLGSRQSKVESALETFYRTYHLVNGKLDAAAENMRKNNKDEFEKAKSSKESMRELVESMGDIVEFLVEAGKYSEIGGLMTPIIGLLGEKLDAVLGSYDAEKLKRVNKQLSDNRYVF